MRKFIIGLIVGFVLATAISATASSNIKLVINGNEIKTDVSPQIIDGRVMVPARYVAEPLGATVEWDGENRAVVIKSIEMNDTSRETETRNNELISANDFISKYDGFISSGDRFIIRNNGIQIETAALDATKEINTFQTEYGEFNVRIINGRAYFFVEELKRIGLLRD